MSKHLLVGGGSENWLLAEGTDLDGLRRTIEATMRSGDVLQLPVYLPDWLDAPVTLLLKRVATPVGRRTIWRRRRVDRQR